MLEGPFEESALAAGGATYQALNNGERLWARMAHRQLVTLCGLERN